MEPNAGPLSTEESALLAEGLGLFDDGQFWHAHESWETMWNLLKRRQAPQEEILLIQGLIQTAALLLHHERKNHVGVRKQWEKLLPKLDGWNIAWGLNIGNHLSTIERYAADREVWALTASDHQIPKV